MLFYLLPYPSVLFCQKLDSIFVSSYFRCEHTEMPIPHHVLFSPGCQDPYKSHTSFGSDLSSKPSEMMCQKVPSPLITFELAWAMETCMRHCGYTSLAPNSRTSFIAYPSMGSSPQVPNSVICAILLTLGLLLESCSQLCSLTLGTWLPSQL